MQPTVDRPVVVPTPPAPAVAPKPVAMLAPSTAPQVAAVSAPRTPEVAGARGFRYSVQLGAFKSRQNAETLLVKAKAVFADATISSIESEGAPVFRVLSGSFADKGEAEARARSLAQSGFTTYVRTVLP
jgi:cell division septation protein DedD